MAYMMENEIGMLKARESDRDGAGGVHGGGGQLLCQNKTKHDHEQRHDYRRVLSGRGKSGEAHGKLTAARCLDPNMRRGDVRDWLRGHD